MKKKILATMLTMTMTAAMLSGCGSGSNKSASDKQTTDTVEQPTSEDDGTVETVETEAESTETENTETNKYTNIRFDENSWGGDPKFIKHDENNSLHEDFTYSTGEGITYNENYRLRINRIGFEDTLFENFQGRSDIQINDIQMLADLLQKDRDRFKERPDSAWDDRSITYEVVTLGDYELIKVTSTSEMYPDPYEEYFLPLKYNDSYINYSLSYSPEYFYVVPEGRCTEENFANKKQNPDWSLTEQGVLEAFELLY